jgi:hypothetical protein
MGGPPSHSTLFPIEFEGEAQSKQQSISFYSNSGIKITGTYRPALSNGAPGLFEVSSKDLSKMPLQNTTGFIRKDCLGCDVQKGTFVPNGNKVFFITDPNIDFGGQPGKT